MSNPAPTLNQINAFNATQGTTIDFNIIGGTEVIRSNKIYIYDLSDNSLICTHLYVSTESIHELPPNTSSSIVYASGKSSADFTNNTQYYAQIQTFTDVGGTQGGSGLSIAKLFWCLPTPTLTLSTIPTTISTTSYNVSATYTPNTSGSATNEIQEFQFNLYSAIGALLQTSGVVLYGEGVDLSYNFSGLEVDSTYYVTLDVTTTQGMNVSAQSSTFTISIDTPTMGSASVVNNGCDGYISVTSNLSSEYEHEKSAEVGEIISFTTDSVNNITELDVDFSPVQDGTPWISTQNTEPYSFRAVPTQTEDFGHESDCIVGGTVAWNQLYNKTGNASGNGVIFTNVNGTITVTGVATGHQWYTLDTSAFPANHKYLLMGGNSASLNSTAYLYTKIGDGVYNRLIGGKTACIVSPLLNVSIQVITGYDGDTNPLSFTPQIFDLTQMFGSTIADYIYSLETADAGAGVAWFKKLFPKPYYAYNAGELMSVQASSHDMVGFNAWDEEWEQGDLAGGSGVPVPSTNYIRSKNFCQCFPSTVYCFYAPIRHWIFWYDAEQNWIANKGGGFGAYEYTSPSNAKYFKIAAAGGSYDNNICINLSDPSLNGTYKSYVKHSYPLDSDLTLRGIPKLDASNNLYYDGDTYASDGTVTRKYNIVDLGSLNWTYNSTYGFMQSNYYQSGIPFMRFVNNAYIFGVCENYIVKGCNSSNSDMADADNKTLWGKRGANAQEGSFNIIYIKDTSYTDADTFKTAMSGVYLVYELATPTTESADPYTNPQIVDPHGTEEYVGSSIPVGHKTTYQRICPITGWTGCNVVVSPTEDAQDGTTYPVSWQTEAGTVYGGTVDLVTGVLTAYLAETTYDGSNDEVWGRDGSNRYYIQINAMKRMSDYVGSMYCDKLPTIKDHNVLLSQKGISGYVLDSSYQNQNWVYTAIENVNSVAELRTWLNANPIQVVYPLATPTEIQLTPQQMQTLSGQNNIWSNTNGGMYLVYQLPITSLLVKRRDVADVSGKWLTLYSTPITQASDMDFTFIDFLNQYGKTYQYALVPVLAQNQSGVIVQIEGGYTVSDNVDSIFDGVYIADQTNVERVKAGVGYGNIDMNQGVGSITPIGSKYPIVITNSQNQYHNGSVRGTIVPNDFYSNGNLSRMDIVNKRDELEQFLTNKRAKIIKDWNGKMWLVMIMSNVACSFDDNYGMGMVSFSADWLEVGDPTSQQDLYNAGLINVGGV